MTDVNSNISVKQEPGAPSASSSSSAAAATSAAPAKSSGARVRVKKWSGVAFWSYDIENDTCAICHNQLMVPCITCEAEPHQAEECSVAWGTCGHSYHFHW